jgi:hypothetical protein
MSRKAANILIALLACLLGILFIAIQGCHAPKGKVETRLPPLPWDNLQGKRVVPRMEQLPEAQQVIVQWQCQETVDAENYITGIEASTDLANWQEVARLPYATQVALTLTNRPAVEFYRAFTGIK